MSMKVATINFSIASNKDVKMIKSSYARHHLMKYAYSQFLTVLNYSHANPIDYIKKVGKYGRDGYKFKE